MPKRKTTHGKSTKKSTKGGRLATYNPRYKSVSGDVVRFFKRPMPDCVFGTISGPNVQALDAGNNPSTWCLPQTVAGDANPLGVGMQFGINFNIQLAQLTQFSDLANLFKQYCIVGCTIHIEPVVGDSGTPYPLTTGQAPPTVPSVGGGYIPSIVSYENISSGGTASTYYQAQAWANSRQQTVTNARPFIRKFKLRASTLQYSSAALGYSYAASNDTIVWQDSTASNNTIYYGPGLWVRNFPSYPGNGYGFRCMMDCWIACRAPF